MDLKTTGFSSTSRRSLLSQSQCSDLVLSSTYVLKADFTGLYLFGIKKRIPISPSGFSLILLGFSFSKVGMGLAMCFGRHKGEVA